MVNKTGIIVGILSTVEMIKIIIDSDDKIIKAKLLNLLIFNHGKEDLVISEFLK